MMSKFVYSKQEAGNAVSYYFTLPNTKYKWLPGQYISLSFVDNDESSDNMHWFTIASAPESNMIQITTRMSGSNYKNRLNDLREGDEVLVSLPGGDFTLDKTTKPLIFVAGGIGITPFHSFIKSNPNLNAHLIYINRDDNYVFKDVIDSYKENYENFKVSYLTGKVEADLLENSSNKQIYSSLVYISGPEAMVEAVGDELISRGLEKELLKRDWFPGYDNKNF